MTRSIRLLLTACAGSSVTDESAYKPIWAVNISKRSHYKREFEGKQDHGPTHRLPVIADTVNMIHIKQHYYDSQESINPACVVPVGPQIDYMTPHGRGNLCGLCARNQDGNAGSDRKKREVVLTQTEASFISLSYAH